MSIDKNALIILTSIDTLGDTNNPTGFYWEELAVPYWLMRDQGLKIELASTKGGEAPYDPASDSQSSRPAEVQRFMDDNIAMQSLKNTRTLSDLNAKDYSVVYLPGGHGTMLDLGQSNAVSRIVGNAFDLGGVVAAVCHGPAGLTEAKLSDGSYLVDGRKLNSFTDSEEKEVGLDKLVPYSLETRLKERGARFEKNDSNFEPYAVRDGMLVTGQNPASSDRVGKLIIKALTERNISKRDVAWVAHYVLVNPDVLSIMRGLASGGLYQSRGCLVSQWCAADGVWRGVDHRTYRGRNPNRNCRR